MSSWLDCLNESQRAAVVDDSDALMIVAGAGSGKTRVLTYKIARLIEQNSVYPSQILAITFTNKAANEMRERLNTMLSDSGTPGADRVFVATFHSACVRFLRKWHDKIGLNSSFSIYDSDDSRRLLRNILNDLNIDPKAYPAKMFAAKISDFKNELKSPKDAASVADMTLELVDELVAKVYKKYQARLSKLGALDFDDLIGRAIELLEKDTEARTYYLHRFRYVLVDEYQDTNYAQYRLVKLLTRGKKAGKGYEGDVKLTVVGDSDQSIYAFRGATIRNILQFEKDFDGAKTIMLEQNYRSVNRILKAANAVISKNSDRKPKNLWSSNGEGEKIEVYHAHDGFDEADYVVRNVKMLNESGSRLGEIAVFFRTNSGSRAVEEKLVRAQIPYKIVGGTKFYERMEIKDVLAYLAAILNHDDDVHLRRILNVPKRGIGKTTENNIAAFADEIGLSFGSALAIVDDIDNINAGAKHKIGEFWTQIEKMSAELDSGALKLDEFVKYVLDETGYLRELQGSVDPQDQVRVENVEELVSACSEFVPQFFDDDEDISGVASGPDRAKLDNNATEPLTPDERSETLSTREMLELYLEQVALSASSDEIPDDSEFDEGKVTLMTLHTAKGLEFRNVFIIGFDDGNLPHKNSLMSEFELSEERRLAYVGITRAKERLFITTAARRNVFGKWDDYFPSRFLEDIPVDLLNGSSANSRHFGAANTDFDDDVEYDPYAGETGFGSVKRVSSSVDSAVGFNFLRRRWGAKSVVF
ncbi:MAG: UvrD-helicase domain-containing protein [Candidatus Ancillula sp.]|jgi:DNA helicase-2/ATP-dependent DNA helicase PcrA|nr:UvrD-helicase domain-containing protein [Candidatus Ancillula sp.]